jgi:hypothetical protein
VIAFLLDEHLAKSLQNGSFTDHGFLGRRSSQCEGDTVHAFAYFHFPNITRHDQIPEYRYPRYKRLFCYRLSRQFPGAFVDLHPGWEPGEVCFADMDGVECDNVGVGSNVCDSMEEGE